MRRRGFGPRAPPKSQERGLVERARALKKDYSPLIPECVGECDSSLFNKIERSLSIVQRFADDPKRLSKFASHGELIARGYAAMLVIANDGKVPYTAATHTPFGEAIYAVRGKMPKEVLIGTQHYDDKRLLLLAYMYLTMKKRLYFYATKSALYCTGRVPEPPEEYVKEALRRIPYKLSREGKKLMCKHLKEGESAPYLRIFWKSQEIEISVCEQCLSKDANLFSKLTEGMGARNPTSDFEIDAVVDLKAVSDEENCPKPEKKGMKKLMDRYVHGKLSDLDFMENAISSGKKGYGGEGRYLIIGRRCYGEDEKAFVGALNPGKYAKVVEEFVKHRDGPIIIESPSVNKLLDYGWDKWGKDALEGILGNEARAELVWKERKKSGKTPLEVVDDALSMLKADRILQRLPEYEKLPKTAEFCDSIARSYKIGGKDAAAKSIDSWKSKDEHLKAIAYAFLSATGMDKGREWQYNKVERELGKSLKDRAERLLKSEGDEYHDALLELLKYAGVNEKAVKK